MEQGEVARWRLILGVSVDGNRSPLFGWKRGAFFVYSAPNSVNRRSPMLVYQMLL